MFKFHGEGIKLELIDSKDVSNGFNLEHNGVMYIGAGPSAKRLYKLNEKGDALELVNDKVNLFSGFGFEYNGVAYIGTYNKGLYRLNNDKDLELVDTTDVSDGFSFVYNSITFVGTAEFGLKRLNGAGTELEPFATVNVEQCFALVYKETAYVGVDNDEYGLMKLNKAGTALVKL